MAALAALPGIESRLLERGTLGMAEELAADLAPLIDDFLSAERPPRLGRVQAGSSGCAAASARAACDPAPLRPILGSGRGEAEMIMRYAVGERDTRPWGTWEVVATGDGHVVKRIGGAGRTPVATAPPPPRGALGHGGRGCRRDDRRSHLPVRDRRARARAVRRRASHRQRAPRRWCSSRSSRAPCWMRTTSSGSRTTSAGSRPAPS